MSLRGALRDLAEHRRDRERLRREAVAMRRARSVRLGDRVTVVFESRGSLLFQLHEALLAAEALGPEAVEREIARHEALAGDGSSLSATVYLEIGDPARIREDVDALATMDQANHLRIDLAGGHVAHSSFLTLPAEDGRLAAARRTRFLFSGEALRTFRDPDAPVFLILDHPIARGRVAIDGTLRDNLRKDLAEAGAATARVEPRERIENRSAEEGG